ncbi:PREDICTED: fasciclin-like arabinogalactan protein 21 [Ipomoea nil]|uniref:fasciclin-like arabinogalactan protein 21 n=1 Tax=Ipomoea nil TaxID=35883 RepID=UPI000900A915|nr:PREDICTED: fasciclin-like arabinogalactan protein 21 [Ipomoea nil]
MADSCSHWWHAPFYLALSVTLAFVAISTGNRSRNPQSKLSLQHPLHHNLSFNASRALRLRGGFTVFAALLQISPELFLSSSPESTVFAVQDPAFFNASLPPPWAIKELLLYHTSPSRLPFRLLLRIFPGSCVSTLLLDKNVKITKIDRKRRSVEINHVLITHPDLFLGPGLSVHGVAGFFSPVKETVQSFTCDSRNPQLEWPRIVQLLSANGFVSFAIGLYSVLDGLAGDHSNLTSVTIFAPPSLGFLSSPSPLLSKVVKLHLLPSKYTYQDLSSLPQGTVLNTLLPGAEVKISFNNSTRSLSANGVEIIAPDVLRSRNFTVHGISRALGVYNQLQNQIV